MPDRAIVGSRLAEHGDQDHLWVLAGIADGETRPQRGGELLLDLDWAGSTGPERLERALSATESVVVVGLIDQVAVGYGAVRCVTQGDLTVAMVDEIFVHPDGRGVGVGAAILGAARLWAVEQGASALESQVLPGNRDAKNFFERLGMVTRQMRVSTPL